MLSVGIPKRIATAISFHGIDTVIQAIDADLDKWCADVLTGQYDADLRVTLNLGPKGIEELKKTLEYNAKVKAIPTPAPPQPQPGPASKANKIADKPSGVSFSIHVSDPYHAAALGYIADMLDSQIADHPVIEWLAYILDHFVDSSCGWHTEDDAVNDLIRAMEKTIKFLRTE